MGLCGGLGNVSRKGNARVVGDVVNRRGFVDLVYKSCEVLLETAGARGGGRSGRHSHLDTECASLSLGAPVSFERRSLRVKDGGRKRVSLLEREHIDGLRGRGAWVSRLLAAEEQSRLDSVLIQATDGMCVALVTERRR